MTCAMFLSEIASAPPAMALFGSNAQFIFSKQAVFDRTGKASHPAPDSYASSRSSVIAASSRSSVVTPAFSPPAKKFKRKRQGGGSSGSDDDDFSTFGGGGGSNGWNGGFGGGPSGGGGEYSNGDSFNRALYNGLWLWQVLCALSLLQALHFVVDGLRQLAVRRPA